MAGRVLTPTALPVVGAFTSDTRDTIDRALQTASGNAPATAAAAGVTGQIAYDATHLYICIATNTWVRATFASW